MMPLKYRQGSYVSYMRILFSAALDSGNKIEANEDS
jgi:hypothetical protein